MKTFIAVITLFGFACAAQPSSAQDGPPPSPVTKEHGFLKKFVGQWKMENAGAPGEDKPETKVIGTMKSSMLGDLWIVNSANYDFGGTKVKTLQMIGYDAKKKKYVGIWADSMINFMWRYEGTVDKSGKKLTLEAKGPSMTDENKMENYRDAYEFKDDNTIIATSSMQGEDGKWKVFMTGTAKRVKKKKKK